MIDSREIAYRARTLGLATDHIEKDHIVNCLLAAISDEPSPHLVFRGGTALARVYWPDFRLSEDLDFVSSGQHADMHQLLARATRAASITASVDLDLQFGPKRYGWSRSVVRWLDHRILIDLSYEEKVYLPVETREIDLPYTDLRDTVRTIRVVSLSEILGNKWFMLGDDDRTEPRDLYDVWSGLIRFGFTFDDLARGHRAKYGFSPPALRPERIRALEPLWKARLSRQIAELPGIDEVYLAVRRAFERWKNASEKGSSATTAGFDT